MIKNVALAVLAHPDDIEFFCGGTLIRLQKEQGWEIHLATMTPGDCGSAEYPPDEIARIRRSGRGRGRPSQSAGRYHCVEERDMPRPLHGSSHRTGRASVRRGSASDRLHAQSRRLSSRPRDDQPHRAHGQFFGAIPNFLHGRWKNPPLEHIPHLYYCDPVDGKDVFGKPIPAGFLHRRQQQIGLKREMLACHASQRNWLIKHHGVDNFPRLDAGMGRQSKESTAGVPMRKAFVSTRDTAIRKTICWANCSGALSQRAEPGLSSAPRELQRQRP